MVNILQSKHFNFFKIAEQKEPQISSVNVDSSLSSDDDQKSTSDKDGKFLVKFTVMGYEPRDPRDFVQGYCEKCETESVPNTINNV